MFSLFVEFDLVSLFFRRELLEATKSEMTYTVAYNDGNGNIFEYTSEPITMSDGETRHETVHLLIDEPIQRLRSSSKSPKRSKGTESSSSSDTESYVSVTLNGPRGAKHVEKKPFNVLKGVETASHKKAATKSGN